MQSPQRLPVFLLLLWRESLVEICSRQPPARLTDDVCHRQTPCEVVGDHIMNQNEPGGTDKNGGYETRTISGLSTVSGL